LRWVASLAFLAAIAVSPVLAQTSASYKLTEAILNSGGDPSQGATLTSASHHIKLDAIGDSAIGVGLGSANFHMDAGFVDVYPPPGEVLGITFASDKKTIRWNPERSIGSYDLYRDLTSTLPGNYGACLQSLITDNTWTDAATPPTGKSWFYLATAKNRLTEEGTKGKRSSGTERQNPTPCP
jgi:hypothetical protein